MGAAGVAALAARHRRTTSFIVMSAVMLAANLSVADTRLYGDASGYWSLARTLQAGDHFSLEGYVDQLRGYSVPLMLSGVQRAAHVLHVDEVVLFRIVSAFVGSALFAVALPALFTQLLGVTGSFLTTGLFCLFGVVYWHGHFLYPLSDFPALLLLAIGVLCLPSGPDRRWRAGIAWSSGTCLALAANARPVYQVALWGAIALACGYAIGQMRRAAAPLAAFALGIVVVLLPQSAINARTLGARSPFAHGQTGPGQPNLYLQQLGWGITIQRYETNINAANHFPVSVVFLDAAGQRLLAERDPSPRRRPATASRRSDAFVYLRLIASHPVFFASAYGRHLFNGLDVAYPTPYVTDLVPRRVSFALVNYLVLTLVGVYGLSMLRRMRLHEQLWPVSLATVFVLPALPAIPTAIEPRFLLPLWMLVYGVFVFRLAGDAQGRAFLRTPYVAALAAIGVAIAFALASGTYAHILGAPASFDVWCLWRC